MSGKDDLRRVFRHDTAKARRERRAARTRARALSPLRIFLSVLALPVLAATVALSVYLRTSPYEPPLALAHLVARAGCDAAASVGLAPSYRGGPGYHARNDADGDGVACEWGGFASGTGTGGGILLTDPGQIAPVNPDPGTAAQGPAQRMVGGAKFIRP